MKRKNKSEGLHVVFGIFRGVVENVFLYASEKPAYRKFKALKKRFGIKDDDGEGNENEVKWFQVPIRKE